MPFVVIAHNIRSAHNVGSLFRTCEGFGARHLYISGYTPFPDLGECDSRLPHLVHRQTAKIRKTALGAERLVPFSYSEDPLTLIASLKTGGYTVLALERDERSVPLHGAVSNNANIALILGEEVNGVAEDLLDAADIIAAIPMHGQKESFNVAVAAGIAMYVVAHSN